MKRITIIILLLVVSVQSYPQIRMAKDPVIKIEFELFGRRGRTEVKITSELAILTSKTEKKYIRMTAEKWSELLTAVNEIELSTVHTLKAPTSQRDVDGALHCRIVISTKNRKYETQYFDSGIPMKQLQQLYDNIESIRNAINYDGDYWKD